MTRSPAQGPACKDLGRKSAFTPITRSPAQKSACKDLGRNGQARAITTKATYTPTSNRAGSRSLTLTLS
ncbi:ATP-dependent nuclease subunit B [Lacticaseibacillus rhamnosus]|nr:ATP-dependent nuclease subunit B [Lacticaseibacillus rhamnosus]MCT3372401.1 ATP-dependent nuclease subunit B [Lacticaseibacillus rhamnosus]QFV12107.1 ATP-dependent nuclease subunit B [Lacticaseibacillus rhamnosus]